MPEEAEGTEKNLARCVRRKRHVTDKKAVDHQVRVSPDWRSEVCVVPGHGLKGTYMDVERSERRRKHGKEPMRRGKKQGAMERIDRQAGAWDTRVLPRQKGAEAAYTCTFECECITGPLRTSSAESGT